MTNLDSDGRGKSQMFRYSQYVEDHELPAIRVVDPEKRLRYVFKGKTKRLALDELVKFVSDYKEGNLEPLLSSEEIPQVATT